MADIRSAAGEGSEPQVPRQDQPAQELANLIAGSTQPDAKGKGFWRRRRRKTTQPETPEPPQPATTTAADNSDASDAAPSAARSSTPSSSGTSSSSTSSSADTPSSDTSSATSSSDSSTGSARAATPGEPTSAEDTAEAKQSATVAPKPSESDPAGSAAAGSDAAGSDAAEPDQAEQKQAEPEQTEPKQPQPKQPGRAATDSDLQPESAAVEPTTASDESTPSGASADADKSSDEGLSHAASGNVTASGIAAGGVVAASGLRGSNSAEDAEANAGAGEPDGAGADATTAVVNGPAESASTGESGPGEPVEGSAEATTGRGNAATASGPAETGSDGGDDAGDQARPRPTVGVVYEPEESADGFPLEYGNIIVGLPKQPEKPGESQPDRSASTTDEAQEAAAEAAALEQQEAEQVAAQAAAEQQEPQQAAPQSAVEVDPEAAAPADSEVDAEGVPNSAAEAAPDAAAEASAGAAPDTAADVAPDPVAETGPDAAAATNGAARQPELADGEPVNDGEPERAAPGAEADVTASEERRSEAAEAEPVSDGDVEQDRSNVGVETADRQKHKRKPKPKLAGAESVNGDESERAATDVEASAAAGVERGSEAAEAESVDDSEVQQAGSNVGVEAAVPQEQEQKPELAEAQRVEGEPGQDAAGSAADPAKGAQVEPEQGDAAAEAGAAVDVQDDGGSEGAEGEGELGPAERQAAQAAEAEDGGATAVGAEDEGAAAVGAEEDGAAVVVAAEESQPADAESGGKPADDKGSGEDGAEQKDHADEQDDAVDEQDDGVGQQDDGVGEDSEAGDGAARDGVAQGAGGESADGGAGDGSDGPGSGSGGSADGGDEGVEELTAERLAQELAAEQAAMALITALMRLRGALAASQLPLEVVGADEARQQQKAMLDQLDDYLLPRLVQLEAPILAVVGGSTGAGKSTLVNTVIGKVVSEPGVLRPTTRSPVLIHHPADADWFVGDRVLPGMARTSSEQPGGMEDAGQLRLVSADTVPRGLAILDAPDIDSVVEANRELATQLLAAADLWLFVTTAARYSDAVPWDFLQSASDRSTAVAVVLDRAPGETIDDVTGHLAQMLLERGLGDSPLFSIQETVVDSNGMLPPETVASIKDWLVDLAADAEARAAVVRRTLQGAVSAMVKKTQPLAEAVKAQADTAVELRSSVETAYDEGFKDIAKACQDGTLLRGEVLARWQEFVGTGELLKGLQSNAGRLRDRLKNSLGNKPGETRDVSDAIQSGLESLLREHAAAAAERAEKAWQASAPGRQLLAAGGPELSAMSEDFPASAERAVREWQTFVLELVRREGADKKATARILEYGVDGLGLSLMVTTFASAAGIPKGAEASAGVGSAVVGQRLLEAVFGDKAVLGLVEKAREDLDGKVHALMDAEFARYLAVLDQHPVDTETAGQLTEAARAVEDCT